MKSASTLAIAALLLATVPGMSQDEGLRIETSTVPGQLDLLQGTAIKLGGKAPEKGRAPEAYHWEIIEGEGGRLLDADKAEAIFQAPILEEQSLELFIVQLTAMYGTRAPARVRIHLRVHRELPEEMSQRADAEEDIREMMNEEAARLKSTSRTSRRDSRVVVHTSGYWGHGPYWGWGWPVHYPIYVPIVVPPPGGSMEPGIGDWDDPIAVPYDELVTDFPEAISDNYLPEDVPFADAPPPGAFVGDGPGDVMAPDIDFIDLPDPGPAMAAPGFGDLGGGFDMPVVEPDFGFDDFGW
jgi:hypothetical protein